MNASSRLVEYRVAPAHGQQVIAHDAEVLVRGEEHPARVPHAVPEDFNLGVFFVSPGSESSSTHSPHGD